MYTYILDLRFVLAAYCKAHHVFLMIFCLYMTLYDICILFYAIYIYVIWEIKAVYCITSVFCVFSTIWQEFTCVTCVTSGMHFP